MLISYVSFVKIYILAIFEVQTMFTPDAIPNKHTEKVKSNEKQPGKKLGCAFCIFSWV